MDDRTFDRLTRIFGAAGSRRAAIQALLAASPLSLLATSTEAEKKKKKSKKKKKKRNNQNQSPPALPPSPCSGVQPDLCGGACVDLRSDKNHCGRCGNACPAGEQCVNGNCSCGSGSVVCEGECVPGNCCHGPGGVTCNGDETCCAPNGCKDLKNDPENCGGCGQASFVGEQCIDGLSVCPEGSIICDAQCQQGNCCVNKVVITCKDDQICCGNEGCKDFAEDPANCGGCGIVCTGTSDHCENSRCVCKAEASGSPCAGGEICFPDLGCACPPQLPSPGTCGACSLTCPEGTACVGGSCSCKDDQVFFEGLCRDCPPPPGIVLPGPKCSNAADGEYCHCGGKCCSGPGQCFFTANGSGQIVEEYCCDGDKQSICDDQCCESPTCDGSCPRQTARYASYRRPGR